MNELIFYVDEFDSVKKCIYKENFKGFDSIYTTIKLPDIELHELFSKFLKKAESSDPKSDSDLLVFSYYDVDVDEIDDLIKKSNAYEEYLNKLKSQYNLMQDKIYTKKINRINKFKRTTFSVSFATLFAFSSFLTSKNIIKNHHVDSNNDEEMVDSVIQEATEKEMIYNNSDNVVTIIDNSTDVNTEQVIDNFDSSIDNTTIISDNDNKEIDNVIVNDIKPTTVLEEKKIDFVFNLDAYDYTDSYKFFVSNAFYSTAIEKYAKMYGIDPQLALAVATHESGYHRDTVNSGGAIGLFQIQVAGGWNWNGREIEAYNFETGQTETVLITTESVSDVFENIKVGCMMIQNLMIKYNYNIALAVTAYNYGENYVYKVISECSNDTGIMINDLNDMNNLEWLNYRDCVSGGDPIYLENVFKYIADGTVLSFEKTDGNQINIEYHNSLSHKLTN